MIRSHVWRRRDVVVAGLVLAAACGQEPRRPAVVSAGPPAMGEKAALLAYAGSLSYWVQLGAADQRPIDDEGVVAKIEPEDEAYMYSEAQLDSGRVVARISKSAPVPVLRFGLGATDTVSYWMVFKKEGKYYGHFFSESGTADTTYQISIDWHDGRGAHQVCSRTDAEGDAVGTVDLAVEMRARCRGRRLSGGIQWRCGWQDWSPGPPVLRMAAAGRTDSGGERGRGRF